MDNIFVSICMCICMFFTTLFIAQIIMLIARAEKGSTYYFILCLLNGMCGLGMVVLTIFLDKHSLLTGPIAIFVHVSSTCSTFATIYNAIRYVSVK